MKVNQEQRAFKAWETLVEYAFQRQPITYKKLASKIGMHHRPIRHVLALIQDNCLVEKRPPLSILVVNQNKKKPGGGFIAWDAVNDFAAGCEQVYDFNWKAIPNPFSYAQEGDDEDSLRKELVAHPERSVEIYAKVKVRGPAQRIFRAALIDIYRKQCAFCGLAFEEALDAAHIIPWHEASSEQRMQPSNGLLLCATHHRLFDSGAIAVMSNYKISCTLNGKRGKGRSLACKTMTTDLHGRELLLPKRPEHRPSAELLEQRLRTINDCG